MNVYANQVVSSLNNAHVKKGKTTATDPVVCEMEKKIESTMEGGVSN